MKKVETLNNLKKILSRLKKKGKKIVFTNGCFDIIHVGHVRYLKQAKGCGDILVIAVNSDSSVRMLKGKNRPLVALKDRLEVLSALEFVDYVVVFSEETPARVIETLRPDILVKGSDYRLNEIVGRDFVESTGGKVVTIPLVKGKSTTALINKIVSTCKKL
ncbi:MAG: D-glycero-beta-D-manno-heptose 1-phosphate adenylyltransferase [bacterium]